MATSGGIPEVCDIMINDSHSTALERLAVVNEYVTKFDYGEFDGTDIDYDGMIDFLRNPRYDDTGDAGRNLLKIEDHQFFYCFSRSTEHPQSPVAFVSYRIGRTQ